MSINIESNIESECPKCPECPEYFGTDGPLIVFIILAFFAMITLIGVRTYKTRPPSVMTMMTLCFAAVISCIVLMTVRNVSIYTEWFLMIGFVLAFMFCITSYMDPNIFFYERTS